MQRRSQGRSMESIGRRILIQWVFLFCPKSCFFFIIVWNLYFNPAAISDAETKELVVLALIHDIIYNFVVLLDWGNENRGEELIVVKRKGKIRNCIDVCVCVFVFLTCISILFFFVFGLRNLDWMKMEKNMENGERKRNDEFHLNMSS